MDIWTAKTRSNTGYCQRRHSSVPETAIGGLHITANSLLPQVGWLKFKLETNSTVVWLYACGVSLILPDVQFGSVSQDWVDKALSMSATYTVNIVRISIKFGKVNIWLFDMAKFKLAK